MLLIVVGFHELGHFIGARAFRVKVKNFAIGFGPPLFSYRDQKKTKWSFNLLPLGGYVSLLDERQDVVSEQHKHESFNHQKSYKKLLIIVLGPLFSLLLAVMIYSVLFSIGLSLVKPEIVKVTDNSLMAKVGVMAGDEIIGVANHKTSDWALVILGLVSEAGSQRVSLEVKNKKGQQRSYMLDLSKWRLTGYLPKPLESLGLIRDKSAKPQIVKLSPALAIVAGITRTKQYITLNTKLLYNIARGYVSFRALSGPLMIFSSAGLLFRESLELFLRFVALLSIAVGVVNLLPIPGLDGGQILVILIEKVRGKPMSLAVELLLQRLSFAFLFVVFMQLLANDFNRLAMMH